MSIHRKPAHSSGGPDPSADSRARGHDRLALDGAAERPSEGAAPASDGPGREQQPADPPETEPQHGSRREEPPVRTVPPQEPEYFEDPQDLAEWVGNLVGSVTGEKPGISRPVPAEPDEPEAGAGPAGEEEEEAAVEDGPGERPPNAVPRRDSRPEPVVSRSELIDRYEGLAHMVHIGGDTLPAELLQRARALLEHAGTRLRLSTDHTVVALAGGTGSGKSSLFNALCGLEFSTVGITRPTTSTIHSCVWGDEGAGPLLDWLGAPSRSRHSRVSELDRGGNALTGLILLDLPDHDSVQADHTVEVDRIIGAADLMIWVLDPQKYADAAVHHGYLAGLAGHGSVMVTVLNQVDRMTEEELKDCLFDLHRLVEQEESGSTRIITTSTVTGEGVDELRGLLTETVRERRASLDRLAADLARLVEEFAPFARPTGSERPGWERLGDGVPERIREGLFDQLVEASGLSAIASTTESAYERRGGDHVAWPVARRLAKLRRDPLRRIQLDLHTGLESGVDGAIGVQRAEVDAAIDEAARESGEGLPDPWPRRIRTAARTDSTGLAERVGEAVSSAVAQSRHVPPWWRAVRIGQYALAALAGLSLVWTGVLAGVGITGTTTGVALLDEPALAVLAAAVAAALFLVGWLVEVGCRNLIAIAAARQREHVEEVGRIKLREAVTEEIVTPIEQELAQYRRFTEQLEAARGRGSAHRSD